MKLGTQSKRENLRQTRQLGVILIAGALLVGSASEVQAQTSPSVANRPKSNVTANSKKEVAPSESPEALADGYRSRMILRYGQIWSMYIMRNRPFLSQKQINDLWARKQKTQYPAINVVATVDLGRALQLDGNGPGGIYTLLIAELRKQGPSQSNPEVAESYSEIARQHVTYMAGPMSEYMANPNLLAKMSIAEFKTEFQRLLQPRTPIYSRRPYTEPVIRAALESAPVAVDSMAVRPVVSEISGAAQVAQPTHQPTTGADGDGLKIKTSYSAD